MKKILFLLVLLVATSLQGKPPILKKKGLSSPPPRIIRTCCSFGSEVKVALIPFKKVTDITSFDQIGRHHYMGDKEERNGLVYTKRGGFIDLGHMRDLADWTGYLYSLIISNQNGTSENILQLGKEGGTKILTLRIPPNLDNSDAALLAGKIAYDLSIWHEIATSFGASYIPMVPERYSSFSPEDLYSNLLGVNMGIKAIASPLEFEEAMTVLLRETLLDLEVVKTEAETYDAIEQVLNIWWTRDKALPSKDLLKKRYYGAEGSLLPWLIPRDEGRFLPYVLSVPKSDRIDFFDLYELMFKLNFKFPKDLFPTPKKTKEITQKDFVFVIKYIEKSFLTSF